jgi:aspartate racemase
MKTIGLIGGMSWQSTMPYYMQINKVIAERLGGLHSAKILLYSFDFHEIEELQRLGDWPLAGERMAAAAHTLEAGGADILVLCTNTMHKVATSIEAAVKIPLLHIVDPTGEAVRHRGHRKVGLLGTRFTMQESFYTDRLRNLHNLDVVLPSLPDQESVSRIIYDELCVGRITTESRNLFREVISRLCREGAEAIILGCTEIALLVHAQDSAVPLFDTAILHATHAAELAIV